MLGHSRLLCIAGLLAAMQFGARLAPAATPEPYDPWPGLVQDIFNNRAMNDGAGVIAIEMPYRAEDAAIVPVTLRATLPPGDIRRVLAITLVIDQNPAPMAARFELGPDASVSEISTRVRVNKHRRSRGRRTERRQALHGENLCEGFRRLLGSGRQERRRSERQTRPDAFQAVRTAERGSDERRPRSPDHDRSPEQFRPADGSGHNALCSRLLRQSIAAMRDRQPVLA